MIFKHSIVLGVTASLLASTTLADVKIGFTGSLGSGTGPNTLRGAGIAAEEINVVGGISGEEFVLASTDTGEDATEDVKAYRYLIEAEEVDFIISGSIDDVSLGWLSRMQGFQIPTLDTWISYIGIIDMVVEDPETVAPYFTNVASGEALTMLYISSGANVPREEMGRNSVVIPAENTTFNEVITGLVAEALDPVAGIETKGIVAYGIGAVDFAPLFSRTQASGTGFIYQVSSVNLQVISS